MCCTSSYSTMKSKAAIKHGEPPRKPTTLPISITLAWTCSELMAGLLSACFGIFDYVRKELLVRIARTFVRCLTGTVHNLSDHTGSKDIPRSGLEKRPTLDRQPRHCSADRECEGRTGNPARPPALPHFAAAASPSLSALRSDRM